MHVSNTNIILKHMQLVSPVRTAAAAGGGGGGSRSASPIEDLAAAAAAGGAGGAGDVETVVYAHASSGSGAVLRAVQGAVQVLQQSNSSSSSNRASPGTPAVAVTDLVEVCRVCGSEGVMAVANVHTPEMPHSLAWVGADSRLCFGGVDTAKALRWVGVPLRGTPEHLVWHGGVGCVVVVERGREGGQWLRVVEGGSMKQVLAVR